jgi:hypothetical protein
MQLTFHRPHMPPFRKQQRKCIVVAVSTALLFGLGSTETVRAQNSMTGDSIRVHATFHHVGVEATISGDDNENGVAFLEYNVNDTGYRQGHQLSRNGPHRFVGSALFLPADADFEVRVTLADPDGVSNEFLEAQGHTRVLSIPQSTGGEIHVAPNGDDQNGDGTLNAPFASIGRGFEAAQPGDTIQVHAGVYHEEVMVPAGGQAGAPITLKAAGDGPVVMDGADPQLKDSAAWTDEGGAVYSAPVAETRYVAVDGLRLWRYESLADLRDLIAGTNGGFTYENGRVYVRLPGDVPPTGHEIQVSVLGRALWLEGTPHVVIDGLIIRCYGAETYSQGIMVRDGAHDVWIVNSTFESVMPGIWVKNDVDDLTVWKNNFSDWGLAEFPWHAVKAQGGMESGAVGLDNQYDGQGIVFLENVVSDMFDGLHICGDIETSQPNNADVAQNVFYHLADDGIETDGICSNVRIVKNRFEDMLVGISTAPAVGGPTYVIRNVITDLNNVAPDSAWMVRAMKFNVGDTRPSGDIFVYHNTAVTTEPDQSAFTVTDDSRWTQLTVLNNIWMGTEYAFYYQNSGGEPLYHDYDLLYATGNHLVRFADENHETVDAYNTATNQCPNCLQGDPVFVAPADGDYGLSADSPAIDQGVAISGINDQHTGDGPDLGALERGGENPIWPDASTRPDATVTADGASSDGATPNRDGALGDGTTDPSKNDSSGCGCRSASSMNALCPGSNRPVFWLLGLLGAFAILALHRNGRRGRPK